MAAKAVLEATRTGNAIFNQRFAPIIPLLNQRLAYAQSMTFDGRASVGTHANLRETREDRRRTVLIDKKFGMSFWLAHLPDFWPR